MLETHAPPIIAVTVTFALSKKEPYHADFGRDTLVGTVRTKSMTYFDVTDDAQYRYYLTHDGQNVDENLSLGQVTGESHTIKFGLRKELIQG